MMYSNLYLPDRIMRILVGLFLVLQGVTCCHIIIIFGLILIYTGSSGTCFIYRILGINDSLRNENYYLSYLPKLDPEPVFIFDQTGKLLFQNQASKRILPSIRDFSNAFPNHPVPLSTSSSTPSSIQGEYQEGEKHYALVANPAGEINAVLVYGYNITKLLEKDREILAMRITDPLTKLPNRAKFFEDLQQLHTNAHFLVLIDLWDFGKISAYYGQEVGDKILQVFASNAQKLIEHSSRQRIYRIQGNTFALLTDTNEETYDPARTHQEVEKIDAGIRNHSIAINEVEFLIEARYGSASATAKDSKTLLSRAETALMEAKARAVKHLAYDELQDIEKRYEQNFYWTRITKKALLTPQQGCQLVPHFQGIHHIGRNRIEKYECLARLQVDDQYISPFFFLEPAKKLNLIETLTDLMIEKCFQAFSENSFEFSINITGQDIRNAKLLDSLIKFSHIYRISPSRVVLELLEDESMIEHAKRIDALREEGFRIAIDDFGSGYSNFQAHQCLHADYIKIDGSLVKGLDKEQKEQIELIRQIDRYSKNIGAQTIAEFVANEESYAILEDLGVDYVQGFHIHKPSPNVDG